MTQTVTDLLADIEPVVRGWIQEQIGDNANSNIPGDQFEYEFASLTDGDTLYYDGSSFEWRNTATLSTFPGSTIVKVNGDFELTSNQGLFTSCADLATETVFTNTANNYQGIMQFSPSGNPAARNRAGISIWRTDTSVAGGYDNGEYLELMAGSQSHATDDFVISTAAFGTGTKRGLIIGVSNNIPALAFDADGLATFQGSITIDINNTEALLVRKNADGGDIFTVDTDTPGVFVHGTTGIDYTVGADSDADLLTLSVTGAPKLWWDESHDSFALNKGLDVVMNTSSWFYGMTVGRSVTNPSVAIEGLNVTVTSYIGVNNARAHTALAFTVQTNASSIGNYTGNFYGVVGFANHRSSGTATLMGGFKGGVQLIGAGDISNAYGVLAQASLGATSAGNITNNYGVFIQTPTKAGGASGDFINSYGIKIADQNTATTLNYAIYTEAGVIWFNAGGDAGTDVIMSGDTEPNLFRMDAGLDAVHLGDWDTNYSAFAVDGTLSFAGSARIGWTKITANGVTIRNAHGTPTGGVGDLDTAHDGDFYVVNEEAAETPGIDFEVDFTGVTAFNWVQILGRYQQGAASHGITIMLEIAPFDGSLWHRYGFMHDQGADLTNEDHSFFVPDDVAYINGGVVKVRFVHEMAGTAAAHNVIIDVCALYQ